MPYNRTDKFIVINLLAAQNIVVSVDKTCIKAIRNEVLVHCYQNWHGVLAKSIHSLPFSLKPKFGFFLRG